MYRKARIGGSYLTSRGVQKGDIVVVKASQSISYVTLYLGILASGAVAASMEHTISDEAMSRIADQLSAKWIVSSAPISSWHGETIQLDAFLKEQNRDANTAQAEIEFPMGSDSADIMFTTGTTGKSKGVEITHRALVATALNYIVGLECKPDTNLIIAGPLNHTNAIRRLATMLVNGSTAHILNGLMNLKRFFDAVEQDEGLIACCLPPSAIRTIFQATDDKIGEFKDRIDYIESASAPLPETDKVRLCRLLPNSRLYNCYGASECAAVCLYDYNRFRGKEKCVGKALPLSTIIITDQNHNPMRATANLPGIIACASETNMKGYINEPELTKEVMENGIVYTSDLGYIGDDGFVYVVGRLGDVINVGGYKVAPTEVEDAALGFPGVEDCVCVAVHHPISGKAPKLLAVCKAGTTLDSRALHKYLAERLESYKVPVSYEQIDAVKRTYNGKIDRKAYR